MLLLPYLGRWDLYDEIRLDEPWDSPHNRPILDCVCDEFQCPSDKSLKSTGNERNTSYLMIVVAHRDSDGHDLAVSPECREEPTEQVIVVEAAGARVHWAQPSDLHVEQIGFGINDGAQPGIRSGHPGGAHVLRYRGDWDFELEFFLNSSDPAWVKAKILE